MHSSVFYIMFRPLVSVITRSSHKIKWKNYTEVDASPSRLKS